MTAIADRLQVGFALIHKEVQMLTRNVNYNLFREE